MSSFKIYNAKILTVNAQHTVIDNGYLEIEDHKIIAIISGTPQKINPQDVNVNGQLVMPGFVNTHTHLPMTIFRGIADDLPLKTWLYKYIWPAEKKFLNKESVGIGSKLGIIELIRSGTTTFNDMYFQSDVIANTVNQSGIRATMGESIIGFATGTYKNTDEALDINRDFISKYKNHPTIHPNISVHAPYSCTTETLTKAKAFADENDLYYNIHISETRGEVEEIQKKYGCRPVEYLDDIKVLDHRTMGAHGVWLNNHEIDIYKKRGAHISHNPTSNLKLGCGFAPIQKYLEKEINVAFGTDGAASNNSTDMMEEIRLATLIHKGTSEDPEVLNAETALTMATINGAKAVGLDKITGSLEVGKNADLIVIDLNRAATTPIYNLYSTLVYAAHSGQITSSMVNGKWLMKNREILNLNESEVLEEAHDLALFITKNL